MKLLIITNLFPNGEEPTRGIFNLQQFKPLRDKGVELKVIAPIPWHNRSNVPEKEVVDGIDVYHPRYFMTPKVGRCLYGMFFFVSLFGFVKKIYSGFKFEKIMSTWAYPDAVGACIIAKMIGKPFYVKVHGSDINMHGEYKLRRAQIKYALNHAEKIISVSRQLKEKLVKFGLSSEKIAVIGNGVDTDLFKPRDKDQCRKKLGLPLDKKIILYTGNFKHVKGVDVLIEAYSILNTQYARRTTHNEHPILVLVGDGPLGDNLKSRVKELGIVNKVIFAGRTTHNEIPCYMNAADVFVLPSRSEGCPNVVLESLACGVPVVAFGVGAVSDIISSDETGMIVEPGNAAMLANEIGLALNNKWDRDMIRKRSLGYSWEDNASELKRELMP